MIMKPRLWKNFSIKGKLIHNKATNETKEEIIINYYETDDPKSPIKLDDIGDYIVLNKDDESYLCTLEEALNSTLKDLFLTVDKQTDKVLQISNCQHSTGDKYYCVFADRYSQLALSMFPLEHFHLDFSMFKGRFKVMPKNCTTLFLLRGSTEQENNTLKNIRWIYVQDRLNNFLMNTNPAFFQQAYAYCENYKQFLYEIIYNDNADVTPEMFDIGYTDFLEVGRCTK